MNSKHLIKQPSAFIPITMSLSVLAIMFISFAISGIPAREADEGTAAHLFQIWLFIEILMVAIFAMTWFPRRPKQALLVLALQITAVLVACAPVFLLNL